MIYLGLSKVFKIGKKQKQEFTAVDGLSCR